MVCLMLGFAGVASAYTLSTITVGSGSIQLSPSGGNYTSGTIVTVTAIANPGWVFDHWNGDAPVHFIDGNVIGFIMDDNYWVRATFKPSYTLTEPAGSQAEVIKDIVSSFSLVI